MKAYPTYKDTNVIWLDKIPASWQVKRIKHNTYVKGRIGWQGLNTNEYGDVGPYLVTGTDFDNGRINWDTCHHISEERYAEDPYIQLQDKDLLITKDGTIGKIALVDNLPEKATLNSGVFVTRPQNADYITRFMYWILNSAVFNTFIDFIKMGSTIQHLYQRTFVEFSYPVPSIPEQQAIADFLDCKTAQIDTLIGKKQRQIDLLQEQRTVLINHVVTKGLNPDAPMKDSGVEWLGKIPKHWEVEELRRHWKVIDCKHKTATYVYDEGIPIVSTTEVKPGRLALEKTRLTGRGDYLDLIEGGRKPKRGDVIYSRNASLGSAAYVDTDREFCMGQDVCLITSDNQSQLFLSYQLNSPTILRQLESVMVGATFKRINIGQILLFDVLRPPVEEQIAIANYLDLMTTKIESLIRMIERQIELHQEYRTALISEAVTGKIDVR